MFYLTNLTKELSIFPNDLGKNIEDIISERITDLEGVVIGENGYIVSIIEFTQKGDGIIDNETGRVTFKIDYKAITFKPFKGEILHSEVKYINEHGFYCSIGPINVFISKYRSPEYIYDTEKNVWYDEKTVINIKDIIPIEIIATKINTTEIACLGKISQQAI